ncbi:VCBS repeat-containing protein [Candidatus Woesearchaeota archaeon]|nr:VCBS repeat-containing protein [Candidatus Woesearchaeota archaeon]
MTKTKLSKLSALSMIVLLLFSTITYAEDKPDTTPDQDVVHVSEGGTDPPDPDDQTGYAFEQPSSPPSSSVRMFSAASSQPPQSPTKADAKSPAQLKETQFQTQLFSGAAQYAYAFELPPGLIQPELSVSYNHHSTLGIDTGFGSGWALNLEYVYRDTNHTQNTSDDSYRLQFRGGDQKLVYEASENRYHTEQESHLFIQKFSGAQHGREYWLVKTKDGTTYRFGFLEQSEQELSGTSMKWSLDRVTDTHGNTIDYTYLENPQTTTGMVYLDKIIYGQNTINMAYDFHAANEPQYINGIAVRSAAHVNNIKVRNGNALVRAYYFDYQQRGTRYLLTKIRERGSDDISELPPIEFEYEQSDSGWEQVSGLPVAFGSTEDHGVRLLDVNGDALTDVLRSKESSQIEYWENTLNGFKLKQTILGLSGGFVDQYSNDRGVRFADVDGDGRTDMVRLAEGQRFVMLNTGTDFVAATMQLPAVNFVENVALPQCAPPSCPSGYADGGIGCSGTSCTRTCSVQLCAGSSQFVRSGPIHQPEWNDNDYDEEDQDASFTPSANKCYSFSYTGSADSDGDDSQCYDLYTDDNYGDYETDCRGNDIDAYAGIGFAGRLSSPTWLQTIPGGDTNGDGVLDYGFIGDVQNSYWKFRYFTLYGKDSSPDTTGSNAGDWDGFNYEICDNAGVQTIHCAPSAYSCSLWGREKCGYGCANEGTGPSVVLGVYADYQNTLSDALNDRWDCNNDIDDNDYYGDGTYEVVEYDTTTQYNNQQCSYVPTQTKDAGVRIGDVNGDGRADIVQATSTMRKTWIADVNGYAENTAWQMSESFLDSSRRSNGVVLQDINADGLPDVVISNDVKQAVYLNTGNGWTLSSYTIPVRFVSNGIVQGFTFIDRNGDGLIDLSTGSRTWLNTGSGWQENTQYNIPPVTLTDFSTAAADMNGDTADDIIVASDSTQRIHLSKQRPPLLKKIGSFGGSTEITYEKIAALDNTGQDDISDLPFSGWIVSRIVNNNGMGGSIEVQYTYEGGMYKALSGEFRGFSKVTETFADAIIAHLYHQDDAKKGLEYETMTVDKAGQPFAKRVMGFSSTSNNGYYLIALDSMTVYVYDSVVSNPKVVVTNYEYDTHGNAVKIEEQGDPLTSADDRRTEIEYVINEAQWLHLPKRIHLFGVNGKTQDTENSYDNGVAQPVKGELTEIKRVIDSQNTAVWRYKYDQHGNLIETRSPKDRITRYAYDGVFLQQITSPLGHTTTYDYDEGTGNILSETDANGIPITYEYDVFGRQTKVIRPYDSSLSPTLDITYETDGHAPESITTKQKGDSTHIYESSTFYDGFGNTIQVRMNAGSTIVTDFLYDAKGRRAAESTPYTSTGMAYAAPQTVPKSTISYDAVDRITNVLYPDGTSQQTRYDHLTEQFVNENGHVKDLLYDAHGRIIEVHEYNENERYTTQYEYDAADAVTRIVNDKGQTIVYDYDGIGRKTQLNDPDMGRWTYEYDDENILEQTDNRNITVSFAYDDDGRMTRKSSLNETNTYIYDTQLNGTLSEVHGPVNKKYSYDQRKRVIQEDTIIDGQTFTTTNQYNTADQVAKRTYANAQEVIFSYDTAGRVSAVNPSLSSVTYNAFNQPTKRTYPHVTTDIDYDVRGRPVTITTGSHQQKGYTYDGTGNLLTLNDNGKTTTYEYDDIERLTRAAQQAYDFKYSYDSVGNIMSITNGALSLTAQRSPSQELTQLSGDSNLLYRTNRPPVIQPLANITAVAGENVTLILNASDPDGDTLVYRADARFVAVNQAFVWQTSESDVGTYAFDFSVNDGITTVISPIIITLTPCLQQLFYEDNDKDGFGHTERSACYQPFGMVLQGNDCNDNNPSANPSATEICDNIDNNCNAQIDENLGSTTCGIGLCQRTMNSCVNGQALACVPNTPTLELCRTGADENCNGQIDEASCTPHARDCRDSDNGNTPFTRGELTGTWVTFYGTQALHNWDYCSTLNGQASSCSGAGCSLSEGICDASNPWGFSNAKVNCQYGCRDGRCLTQTESQQNLAQKQAAYNLCMQNNNQCRRSYQPPCSRSCVSRSWWGCRSYRTTCPQPTQYTDQNCVNSCKYSAG